MREWHCVISRPNQETRAAIELANQDFEVFLPVLDRKPMFPRYLFVAFDSQSEPWGRIKSTRGCVDLLKVGFVPAVVPKHAMEAIITYRPPQEPQEAQVQFEEGDAVIIQTGPLQGLQGLFVADRHKRVMALLEIMGKKIEVPRDSIRAA